MASLKTTSLPVLHVEARLKADKDHAGFQMSLIKDSLAQWVVNTFQSLTVGQKIQSFDGLGQYCQSVVELMVVTECSGDKLDAGTYNLQAVELKIEAYQLQTKLDPKDCRLTQIMDQQPSTQDAGPSMKVVPMPNEAFDGLWESLRFDQPLHWTLLRAVSRMASLSTRDFNRWSLNWNRLVLLWGPPGTGKTSLCRALAQKLAICLGEPYKATKLVEVQANSLGSKYYNESAKLVSLLFEQIEGELEREVDTFICLLVDEIESLACQRQHAMSIDEPFDTVRAVNALLTGLDRVRMYPNVVVLATSNLITALDEAFLDRVDIKQYLPALSTQSIYGIYKDCLEELSRCGIIQGASFDVVEEDPDNPETSLRYLEQPANHLTLPTFEEMLATYQMFPHAVPTHLGDLAKASMGFSGRALRRLPVLSVVFGSCARRDIHGALAALQMGIEAERQSKMATMKGLAGAKRRRLEQEPNDQ